MHIDKAKSSQVIGYILHDTRACENHTNEKIDPAKAELNYNLVEGSPLENFNKRMSQVYMRKSANANALAMFSTTLPKDFPSERSEEFFRACHRFYCDRFGEENIISDIVHRDETTDHMHTKFIPVYYHEKNERDTVSFDKVVNRKVYRTIHKDLQKYLENEFGFEVHILNGATAGGNKTVEEMKAEELKRKNQQLREENERLEKENNKLIEHISKAEDYIDMSDLDKTIMITKLKKENETLKHKHSMLMKINKQLQEFIKSIIESLRKSNHLKAADVIESGYNKILKENLDLLKKKKEEIER